MTDLQGQTLGKYEIEAEIGRGAMAVVYRAWDPVLQRAVALKLLKPEFANDAQFVARFQREARAAARLRHRGIVAIHDIVQEGERHYIVMELLEGVPLSDLLRGRTPLPWPRVQRIVAQVADALDYAHARGIIHRDVKPGNILIGDGDQATLTDFGIAKALSDSALTLHGTLLGTPEYMAPEQIEGRPVDRRADVYALGVVAYEMLTGIRPFRGKQAQILYAQVHKSPPPLNQFADVPHSLETAVQQAMAKSPQARFDSAGAFAAALSVSPSVRKQTTPPAAAPAPEPARRPKRRPWLLIGIIGLLAVLALTFFLTIWLAGGEINWPGSGDTGRAPAPTVEPTLPAVLDQPTAPPPTAVSPTPEAPALVWDAARAAALLPDLRYRRENGAVLFAPKTTTPPRIDGDLGEWTGPIFSIEHVVHQPETWSGPDDLGGRVRLAWDQDNLYLAIERSDDARVQTGRGEVLYRGDAVEIECDADLAGDFDDAGTNGDDCQFGFSAGDFAARPPEAYIWRPAVRPANLLDFAVTPLDQGYILEAAIPWTVLGGLPAPETPLGFNVNLDDCDRPCARAQETMLSTSPNRRWGDPTTYGTLVLVDW